MFVTLKAVLPVNSNLHSHGLTFTLLPFMVGGTFVYILIVSDTFYTCPEPSGTFYNYDLL